MNKSAGNYEFFTFTKEILNENFIFCAVVRIFGNI